MSKKWQKVGAVLKKKNGEGFYMKVEQDIPAGSFIQLQNPIDRVERIVKIQLEKGEISQDEADAAIAKVPDFVKYDLILPPAKDDSTF